MTHINTSSLEQSVIFNRVLDPNSLKSMCFGVKTSWILVIEEDHAKVNSFLGIWSWYVAEDEAYCWIDILTDRLLFSQWTVRINLCL